MSNGIQDLNTRKSAKYFMEVLHNLNMNCILKRAWIYHKNRIKSIRTESLPHIETCLCIWRKIIEYQAECRMQISVIEHKVLETFRGSQSSELSNHHLLYFSSVILVPMISPSLINIIIAYSAFKVISIPQTSIL